MIRLLIADDHPIIVAGIEALLRGTDYEVAVHLKRGDGVLNAVVSEKPDMLVLDERMPGKTGLDVFRELRGKGHFLPVILLTGTINDQRGLEAIDSGVNGIVLKHSAADHLLQCLDEVGKGNRWIDQSLLQRALDRARGKEETLGLLGKLTAREREIVKLIAENIRNAEIGARLGISEGTVKVHLHNAYEKLGLRNRVDLLMLIRDAGLGER